MTIPTPEQAAAAKLIAEAPVGVVTGGPGTGKTTSLREAIRIMNKRGIAFTLLAPTGRAARRMSEVTGCPASTIHRMIAAALGDPLPSTDALVETDTMFDTGVFIVDEASMLDVELCARLMVYAGSRRVIFMGDADQLPSISPGRVLADLIESGVVPVVRLTKVHRSDADSWVYANAPLILRGADVDLTKGPGFEFVELESTDDIREALNERVSALRMDHVEHAVLTPQRGTPIGVNGLNSYLQMKRIEGYEEKMGIELSGFEVKGATYYVGDPVRHTKNNYQLNVFNGEFGVVTRVDDTGAHVSYNGNVVFYNHLVAEEELILSYATTIHSSQGGEFDTVFVVIHDRHSGMWDRTLLYTAVTRAKKKVVLIGMKSTIRNAIRNMENQRRTTTLKERLTT